MTDQAIKDQNYREIKKVTLVGAAANLALAILKIFSGVVGHSNALIVDGVHSLSDLGSDFLVIWASKKAVSKADHQHPYGHLRYQTVATFLLGLLLAMVALGIVYDTVISIFSPQPIEIPTYFALTVAILSVLSKEALFHYTRLVGKKVNSKLLRANAWHHRSDAFSSVVVIVGILGSIMGFPYFDGIAAILVAAVVFHVSWQLVRDNLKELLDIGLDKKEVEEMQESILFIEGVQGMHQLRTRLVGDKIIADAHIQVSSMISVSEGHRIGDEVLNLLKERFRDLSEITIHIDPEDDDAAAISSHLPLRSAVNPQIRNACKMVEADLHPDKIVLHYLDGRLHADIEIPLSMTNRFNGTAQDMQSDLIDAVESHSPVDKARILFI